MTNTTEEMSGGEEASRMKLLMMPTTIGASSEAPSMHEEGVDDDDHAIDEKYEDDHDDGTTEQDLIMLNTIGSAAKAYRQQRLQSPKEPDTDTGSTTTSSTTSTAAGNMNDDDAGGDAADDDDGNTTNENEATLNGSNDITTTAATTSALGDDDDYVGKGCEEEYGSYKTTTLADQTQSEQFIQQPKEELAKNALISTLGLFLVKTWNWLHYTFVTIIFLNFVHFVRRGRQRLCDSVLIREASSVEVEGAIEEEVEESESGNSIELGDNLGSESEVSLESNKDDGIMSPNTCSIQATQEVEKAEEAIIGTESMTEKGIAQVIITPPEDVTPVEEPSEETAPVEELQQQRKQITIILPEDDESDECEDNIDGLRRDSVDSVSSEGSGNLGDTEDGSGEKSEENSNDGDSNSDVTSNMGEESAKDVAQKIISQVESMFSDEHLAKDGFLLKHVRRRSDGFVSLKLVAGLRKVKQISREFPVVLDALKDSTKLEVNSEGTKVRRVEALTQFLKAVPIKSKDQKPGKEGGSSNDETPQIINSTQNNNKSKAGKENAQSRRHSAHVQNNANPNNGNQNRRNSSVHSNQNNHNNRKSSNASTSSNNSSRNNSFSKAPGIGSQHPADLFRNVYTSTMMAAYSSSGEDSPQVGRRRGGSLPITALQRSSGSHLSPNSSPPNGAFVTIGPNGGARPKSNSYCEGAIPSTMSPWLQRRKASASRLSTGELVLNGVVRQPRGPDGTKGFASGYRSMIIEERLSQQSNSAVSA